MERSLMRSSVTEVLERQLRRAQLDNHGLCVLDASGTVLFINTAGEELLGWSSEQLLGRDFAAVVAGSAAELEELRAAIAGYGPHECAHARLAYRFWPCTYQSSDETVVLFCRR
jgi:PAS domain S-box-containing protein